MKAKIRKAWDSRWYLILSFVWLLSLVIEAVFPTLDSTMRPAVLGFKVDFSKSWRKDDRVVLAGSMVKVRCTFIGVAATGISSDDKDPPIPINLMFMDNPKGINVNRPPGPQEWGPWEFKLNPPPPEVYGIKLVATHQCTPTWFDAEALGIERWVTWTIRTQLGPVIYLSEISEGNGPKSDSSILIVPQIIINPKQGRGAGYGPG